MARGWFPLSHELLKQALYLPDDAEILGVEYLSSTTCQVWVKHKDIPESKEDKARGVLPVFKREGEEVTMIEWSEDFPLATLDVMDHNARHIGKDK